MDVFDSADVEASVDEDAEIVDAAPALKPTDEVPAGRVLPKWTAW